MKKTILGTVILVVVLFSLIMSSRGIAVDVDLDTRLANAIAKVAELESKIATLSATVASLETKIKELDVKVKLTEGFTKATASPNAKKAEAKLNPTKTDKKAKFAPSVGDQVFLNAEGTKFHFWHDCTWFGYGDEYNITSFANGAYELTNSNDVTTSEAKPCMLCEMHKIIKQK
jgi:uncharacterized coiled-coil protein SlyX